VLTEVNGRTALLYIKQDPKNWITMAKFGLMMNGLYGLQQTFVKYSLLALYHRTFWVNRTFVGMVWTVAVDQGMWGIVVLLCHSSPAFLSERAGPHTFQAPVSI
jgi:hypothetical protein